MLRADFMTRVLRDECVCGKTPVHSSVAQKLGSVPLGREQEREGDTNEACQGVMKQNRACKLYIQYEMQLGSGG